MCIETDLITAFATVGAAVVSIVATIAALKSAAAAKSSADTAAEALHRSAVRELTSKCHDAIEQELIIQRLIADLRQELIAYDRYSGSYQNTGIGSTKDQLASDLQVAAEQTKAAKELVVSPEKLIAASANDLDLWQANIEASLARLGAIRESKTRELDKFSTRNKESRDQQKRPGSH